MNGIDTKKWIVLIKPMGRLPTGIYVRHVTIGDTLAFIHPQEGGRRADIIPAQNVFDSERLAKEYLAAGGKRFWVVNPGDGDEPCSIFEALVTWHSYERGGQRWNHGKSFKRLDGTPVDVRTHATHHWETFSTKKEATKAFNGYRTSQKKEALQRLEAARALYIALSTRSR